MLNNEPFKAGMDKQKLTGEQAEWLMDVMPDAILVINAEGVLLHANHQAELLFGYSLEELAGQPPELLIPEHLRAVHTEHRSRFYELPRARPMGAGLELTGRRKDGSLFPVDIALNPVQSAQGLLVIASVRDISDKRTLRQALQEGEESYRNLMETLPEIVYRVSGDLFHGRVDFVSGQVKQLLGYAPADFYCDPELFLHIIHPDDVTMLSRQTQRLLEGADACTRSYRMRRQDTGEYRHMEDVVVARRDAKGQLIGVEGAARDVTERVLLERELREQQTLLQAVVDSAHESILVSERGRALFVNKAFLEMHGLSSEREAQDLMPLAWVFPEDRGRILARQEARQRGERTPAIVEYRILRPSGEVRWVQASGTSMNFRGSPARLSIIRDVTELKQAEQALAENEGQYRAVVENAAEGITVSVNGLRVFANSSYLKLVGASDTSQVINQPIDAMYLEEERPVILLRHLARAQGRQFPEPFAEFHLRRFDGQLRTVQTSNVAIRYKGQAAVMAVVRDVTEQRATEDNLKAANQRLAETLRQLSDAQAQSVRQERLNALGTMASGIVHDFNNALTPIVGLTSLILERPEVLENKEELLRYVRICNAAAQNAGDIVDRLREFYRPKNESEPFSLLDLNLLVREAADLTSYVWQKKAVTEGKSIALGLDLSPGAHVMGNPTELKEVLTNLIINSVDAIPLEGAIRIRTATGPGGVRIDVEDTGKGMPQEVMKRCFEPFFTTKGNKGTGMGLAVAYGIVQRHNGRIDVQSEVGKGTKFVIHLPAVQGPQSA